jgi:Spy/CpxP family protein refolding chaperone
MTEQKPAASVDETSRNRPCHSRRRRFGVAALVILLSAGFAGALATNAWSNRFGGHCGFMQGPSDPARAERHAAVFADHIADKAEATTEQREKLVAVAKAAAKDIAPLRQKMQDARKQGGEVLSEPTVDRARIEQLRTEQVANVEAISKRMTQALADAADVLTPDQRKKLAEAMLFGNHEGWWGHDSHFGGHHGGHWGRERE